MIDIIIGGDLCPIGKNIDYFKHKNAIKLFGDALSEFKQASLSIVNLECPLISSGEPILKVGPSLFAKEDGVVETLVDAGIDMVGLANNHIMDYGPPGLMNTIDICMKSGLEVIGAGVDIEEASKMRIKELNGIRVGILAVAEHEFSIATKNYCGANPIDLIDYIRIIKSMRDSFDYLIVLYHGGNIHYPYPSPNLKKTCEFLVEMGANAVIVQHTHCPGCYENYKNGHIVYGQGNLLFDLPDRAKSFYEGMLVKLSLKEDGKDRISFIPYNQSREAPGIQMLTHNDKSKFMDTVINRSNSIKDNSFVQSRWVTYCAQKKLGFLNRIYGINSLFRNLIFRNLFLKYLLNEKSIVRLLNTISCESHRETLVTILDDILINGRSN